MVDYPESDAILGIQKVYILRKYENFRLHYVILDPEYAYESQDYTTETCNLHAIIIYP